MSDRQQYPAQQPPGGWLSNAGSGWPPPGGPQGAPPPASQPPPWPPAGPTSQPGTSDWGPQSQQNGFQPSFTGGQAGRDPRLPFGAQPPPQTTIDSYQPPRSRKPFWITLGVVVATVALLILGTQLANRPAANTTASASVSATPQPSVDVTTNGVRFENSFDNTSGYWEITNTQWTGDQVVVTMKIRVDSGTQPLDFFVLNNDTDRDYDPTPTGDPNDLVGSRVSTGETREGTVTFSMPHGESTIYLCDSSGRQVTALVIPA